MVCCKSSCWLSACLGWWCNVACDPYDGYCCLCVKWLHCTDCCGRCLPCRQPQHDSFWASLRSLRNWQRAVGMHFRDANTIKHRADAGIEAVRLLLAVVWLLLMAGWTCQLLYLASYIQRPNLTDPAQVKLVQNVLQSIEGMVCFVWLIWWQRSGALDRLAASLHSLSRGQGLKDEYGTADQFVLLQTIALFSMLGPTAQMFLASDSWIKAYGYLYVHKSLQFLAIFLGRAALLQALLIYHIYLSATQAELAYFNERLEEDTHHLTDENCLLEKFVQHAHISSVNRGMNQAFSTYVACEFALNLPVLLLVSYKNLSSPDFDANDLWTPALAVLGAPISPSIMKLERIVRDTVSYVGPMLILTWEPAIIFEEGQRTLLLLRANTELWFPYKSKRAAIVRAWTGKLGAGGQATQLSVTAGRLLCITQSVVAAVRYIWFERDRPWEGRWVKVFVTVVLFTTLFVNLNASVEQQAVLAALANATGVTLQPAPNNNQSDFLADYLDSLPSFGAES